MYCISISYKSADLEFRKKFAFSDIIRDEITVELLSNSCISECVLLCTCNRTEVYFCADKSCEGAVTEILARKANVDRYLLSRHTMFFCGDRAIVHLFNVACGIDSMVVGEDEILGQTKNAYLSAKNNNAVSYELNMIFQSAFACAKKIKTQTALSKTSVSVATLAANEAARLGSGVKVLVIGASGKIGATVLKNLVSHKNVSVRATFRHRLSQLGFFKDIGVQAVDYKKRYEYINDADCIISATSSPHYTITLYDLKKYLSDGRKRLFIDLAVPPDIDRSVADFENASLVDIDYFEQLAKNNNALKADSVEAAKEIISDEIDILKKDLIFHDFLPYLNSVKKELSDKPFETFIYKMKSDASAEEFSSFISVLRSFANME